MKINHSDPLGEMFVFCCRAGVALRTMICYKTWYDGIEVRRDETHGAPFSLPVKDLRILPNTLLGSTCT